MRNRLKKDTHNICCIQSLSWMSTYRIPLSKGSSLFVVNAKTLGRVLARALILIC